MAEPVRATPLQQSRPTVVQQQLSLALCRVSYEECAAGRVHSLSAHRLDAHHRAHKATIGADIFKVIVA